jgi:hypothetical protein
LEDVVVAVGKTFCFILRVEKLFARVVFLLKFGLLLCNPEKRVKTKLRRGSEVT